MQCEWNAVKNNLNPESSSINIILNININMTLLPGDETSFKAKEGINSISARKNLDIIQKDPVGRSEYIPNWDETLHTHAKPF